MFGSFFRKKLTHEQVAEHLDRLPKLMNAFQRQQVTAVAVQAALETHGQNVADVKALGGKI